VWVWASGGAAAAQDKGAGMHIGLHSRGLGTAWCLAAAESIKSLFSSIEEKGSPGCVSWKETVLTLYLIRSFPSPHRASPDAFLSSLALHPWRHGGDPRGFQLLVPAQSHSSIPRVCVDVQGERRGDTES